MIQVLIGKKGSGKTKTLVDNVNATVKTAKGNLVFISSDTKRHMYDISHDVRLVDTGDFTLKCYDEFYGFLCGLISNNFDISNIYIDSIYKIVDDHETGMEKFFEDVNGLSEKFGMDFLFTMSMDTADAPEYLAKYLYK